MKQLSLICLLVLFVTSLSHAQKRYDEIEYPEINEFTQPDVETFTLDNGIQFYLVEDRELPLIDMTVLVRTGGVLVPNDKAGLASITGTVIRSGGSEKYPADSLNTLLENKAASMETSIGFSSGSATMNVLKEDFDELLPVFIDLLTQPVFPEEKIELAKTQIKSGISRRNDNPQQIAFREYDRLIYGENSIYGRNTEYETVNNITREDIVDFHNDHFTGENLMIGLVGDFDADEMEEDLREAFSSIPAGSSTNLEFPEVDYTYGSSINFVSKSDVNQSVVLLGHIGGLRENPDYAELQVMNEVLSGGFSGRLFQEVRTDLGLAYSVFGQYEMNTFYPGTYYAGVMTKSSTTAEAVDAIIGEIERLQNEPITEKELQDTKDQFFNSLVFRFDSYEDVLSERLSNEYRGLSANAFDEYVEGVRNTTIQDVQRVAQEYLNPDQLEILVVGNADEIGDQLQKYGDVNEIDISIPEPGAQEETVEGDATAGQEWINRMASAILPDDGLTGSVTMDADNKISTPQGEMNLGITQTMDFESERIEADVSMPQGQISMLIEEGQGSMQMGGNTMPMQPAQKDQMLAELYRSPIYLALNKDELDVEFMGMEEMDGEMYANVRVNAETTLNLYLDPETALPMITTYRTFNPQVGGMVTVQLNSMDWRESDGLMMPYQMVSYADGEQASSTTVTSHGVE